jgi:sugar diacid utilization regulator/GAF domain-containing protein
MPAPPKHPDRLVELSSDELAHLLEVSQGLSGSLDVEQVLSRIAQAARELLETDMSTVLILDAERQLLTMAAFAGLEAHVARRLSTPVGENLAGLAAQLGQCVRTSDISSDRRSALGEVCAGHIRSAMLAPMMHDGKVLGVLGVETAAMREFTERDERLLRLLAKHGAIAIETARLYAAEQQRVEQLNGLLDRLNAQNDIMRRTRAAHDRLTEAALEGLGHASLLHVLIELVPAPVVLTNQFGTHLCAAAPDGDERVEPLWDRCASSPAFPAQLAELRANAGLAEPARVAEAGFWRTVVVVAAGELLGALVILDHSQLEELHIVVLEEAASVLATEMLRERGIAEAEARASGDLVQMLVSEDGWGPGAQERAALLGHDLTGPQCVVAIGVEQREPLPVGHALVSAARRAAARTGLRALAGECHEVGVVLLTAGDRGVSRECVEAWIAGFSRDLHDHVPRALTFGVSAIPSEPRRICEAFASARQALAVCRLGAGRQVTYFEDVQLIATLVDISNQSAVNRHIESTIGKLLEYDRRKQTELSHTLETYLDYSGVARHAAKALFLHPHSLRYRLRRICEIQGLDLADPMVRLTTHLSLKLHSLVREG